jgi:G:T-mismatch repair DNA endonuclease (very short patch repair protein)
MGINGRKSGTRLSKETLDNEVMCLVCNQKLKNPIALSKHLKFQHNLKSKEYYDRYVKKEGEGICPICGKETILRNLSSGYNTCCSKKCLGKYNVGDKNPFYGHSHTEETKKTIGKASSERIHTEETKQKIADSLRGIQRSEEYCENMSKVQMGHEISDETKKKIGEQTSLAYKTWRESNIDTYNDFQKRKIKATLAKVCERPNKFEQNCQKALELEWPGKFKYVGDGSVLINFKSPDFINEEDKVIVLCHGIYWHLIKDGYENNIENKKLIENKDSEPFEKVGYKVIVLWEDEI